MSEIQVGQRVQIVNPKSNWFGIIAKVVRINKDSFFYPVEVKVRNDVVAIFGYSEVEKV